jgi:hypothetical protein
MSDKAHEDTSVRDALTNMDGIGSSNMNDKGSEVKDTQEKATDAATGAAGMILNLQREERRRSERLIKEIATTTDEKNCNMAKKRNLQDNTGTTGTLHLVIMKLLRYQTI